MFEAGKPARYVALIDGEHYPPVVQAGLEHLSARGDQVLAAVLVGGREKLPAEGVSSFGDVEVRTGDDARFVLDDALVELRPDAVADLSDEPVLDYRRRHALIAVALARGVDYVGADFRYSSPPRPELCDKPSLAIIGTGKRTGKTAVAGFTARALAEAGRSPVVVAMGRGGPPEPEVLRGDEVELSPAELLELAEAGKHAASDYVEDALLARVPTVGCRRCGGGLAGGVEISNVSEGIAKANELPGDILILEGSGSAIPPAHADVTALVVSASIPAEYLTGYMGPYRMLLADIAVVTMCEEPFGSSSQISEITSILSDAFRHEDRRGRREAMRVVRTVFRPAPTRPVDGAEVFVATTAPESAAASMKSHLEEEHDCKVIGMSHSLSDRRKLEMDLEKLGGRADVLLCEIKAAGIDVATRRALDEGIRVVFMDNVPVAIDGDDLTSELTRAAHLAEERFQPHAR